MSGRRPVIRDSDYLVHGGDLQCRVAVRPDSGQSASVNCRPTSRSTHDFSCHIRGFAAAAIVDRLAKVWEQISLASAGANLASVGRVKLVIVSAMKPLPDRQGTVHTALES